MNKWRGNMFVDWKIVFIKCQVMRLVVEFRDRPCAMQAQALGLIPRKKKQKVNSSR
jgi:hypothetical protein